MHRSIIVTYVAWFLVLVGCASTPRVIRPDPYLVSKKSFKKSIKVIAVTPLQIPEGMVEPGPVILEFSSLIDSVLASYGFSVIRPQRFDAAWRSIAVETGAFSDSASQERDEVRLSRELSRALAEFKPGIEVQGVLFPRIVVVQADFGAGSAVWDGVKQNIEAGSVMTSFFAGSQRGVVGATSLVISVRGNDGSALFHNSGGIEILSKLIGKSFVNVSPQELFKDRERNREAVQVALKPLKR